MNSEDRLTLLGIVVIVCFTMICLWLATLGYKERTAHCGPVLEPTTSIEETDQ